MLRTSGSLSLLDWGSNDVLSISLLSPNLEISGCEVWVLAFFCLLLSYCGQLAKINCLTHRCPGF